MLRWALTVDLAECETTPTGLESSGQQVFTLGDPIGVDTELFLRVPQTEVDSFVFESAQFRILKARQRTTGKAAKRNSSFGTEACRETIDKTVHEEI